jgi:glycosyltransferase involved in cell wall biosynthesis
VRVGVDARVLDRGEQLGLGVRRFLERVLEQTQARGHASSLVLYTDAPAGTADRSGPLAAFACRRLPAWRSHTAWEQVALPAAARRDGIDVLWSPCYTTALWLGRPRVVNIHDISFDRDDASGALRRLRRLSKRSAEVATSVMTCSEFSRQDIVTRWGVPGSKVKAIHMAADPPEPGWERRAADTIARLGVAEPYLLHVGTLYTRRRIPTLLEAYTGARRVFPDVTLVVVGRNRTSPPEPLEDAMARINEEAGRRVVHHLPYVDEPDLAPLFGRARAFVYLSTLEGFGLPPLEAMAYGVPVITTTAGSLAEVTPGAARLVDPTNADDVAGALVEVLGSAEVRAALSQRGLARARAFSWERCARQTWDVLASAAEEGGPRG